MTDQEFLQKLDAILRRRLRAKTLFSSSGPMTFKKLKKYLPVKRNLERQIQELLESRPLPAQPNEIETSAPSWAELSLKGEE